MRTKLLIKEKTKTSFFTFLNQTKLLIAFTFCMFLQIGFAQVTITPWKMNKGGGAINYSLNSHGDPIAYSQMNIPNISDVNWTLAPVNSNGEINFSARSILSRCLQQLDFTYFETFINIPANFNVSDLNVSFTAADDGARAYIFNSSHPNGAFIGEIRLGQTAITANYASLTVAGESNRLVIVQFDDCPSGNNLTGAKVNVNGQTVAINNGGCTTSNFFWSNPPTVNGKTASGTINGVAYTYTSSVNVRTTSNVFAHSLFPASFNVPNNNPTIQNIEPSTNTLTFASPMTNPVLVFSSIGGGPISVPINFSAPVEVLWSTSSGSGSSFVQNSPTQITGKEAYAIVRMNGTFSSISFDYLVYENYVNFVFGADFSTSTPDTMPPTVTLNGSATQAINAGTLYTDPGATVSDNCDTSPTLMVSGSVDVNVPGTYTLTYNAVDASGNVSPQLTRTVTVVNPAPIVMTQNITVNLDANGSVTVTPQQIDNGSSSVVGIQSLALDKTTFDCTNLGINTVILTVTSNSGNTATATANVTVVDNIAPTVITKDITVQLDATGKASIIATDIDNGSNDACGVASIALDAGQGNFTCANVGVTNTVTLAVTDVNGNTATGTANVTVVDVTPPTVITQNITVQLDATGKASIVAADIDNGSNDACGVASIALDAGQGNFTCANVGVTNTVTLAVTDVNGNTATGTANVTVVDVTAPTVVTQNIIVQLDANGQASATAQQFDGGSTDACGIDTYTLGVPRGGTVNLSALTCEDVGTHNVSLTVTDIHGNAASGTATVTVVDITAPTVVTQNVTVQLDANGTASVTAQQFDGGSTDACGIDTYTLGVPRGGTVNLNALTCADVGTHNVTLTVTDINGNAATGTAQVTVEDTTAPTVITQSFTTTITGGVATVSPTDVDGGSYDNCAIESMSVSPNTFVCGDQGNHTVTLTVTDVNGNVSTGTVIVTVLGDVPTISIDSFTAVATQNTNTVYLGYGPQSVTLNTNTTGGTGFTYNWTSSTGELVSSVANPTISPLVSTTYTVTVTNANGCEATTSIDVCVIDARAIDDEGEYEGKVLVCKGNSDDDDKEYSSKDEDDDDDDDSHESKTKDVKVKDVEKFLHKGYTLGACNATCTTTYVEVVVDNDDGDHHDDHADSDDDKDDHDNADNDDSSNDDDKSDKDDDKNNNSRSGKVKVIVYPNPIVDKVVIGLNTKKKSEGEVKVFDYRGRKIFGKKAKNLKKGVRFNMERYKSGTYFVRIKHKGKVYTAIIFKER